MSKSRFHPSTRPHNPCPRYKHWIPLVHTVGISWKQELRGPKQGLHGPWHSVPNKTGRRRMGQAGSPGALLICQTEQRKSACQECILGPSWSRQTSSKGQYLAAAELFIYESRDLQEFTDTVDSRTDSLLYRRKERSPV